MKGLAKLSLLLAGVAFWLAAYIIGAAYAQDSTAEATPEPSPVVVSAEAEATPEPASNEYCLLCHTKPDQVWTLPSGETLSVTIDPTVLAHSVHGEGAEGGALACADCHGDFRYPHQAGNAQSIREFQIERYASCRTCHEEQYTRAQDSVHGQFLREGRLEAATCVDCHGGHDIQSPNEPRQRVSLTCGSCHGVIFEEYRTSVHGAALLDENNPDVPTCIDCHGVHDIHDPTTGEFRSNSPEMCATCHANEELMAKYGISTQVFDSYVSEFHGSTMVLFDHAEGVGTPNKAVCFDCHGVHNIQPVSDETGVSSVRENLVTMCQQCHPNAGPDFSAAWVGHYPATAESRPVNAFMSAFYAVLMPVAVILVALIIVSDVVRRIRRRRANGAQKGG
ncbi:MAG: cytochrome c3 family protein [Anaerolineae bacterium]